MAASSERQLAEQEADERLRDAAPELLGGLIACEEIMLQLGYSGTAEMIGEIIAKATGKQP